MSYDVEDDNIVSNVFKDSFPESWKQNPDFAQYLSELCSYGVEKLGREPSRLAEQRSQIQEQTEDLAFHNYKTFIETAECSREIFQDFQIIERHLESMLEKVPQLSEACGDFTKQAQNINTARRMNNVTLQRNTQLLEILEMPQLMDTCVRNSYYEEALELVAHVKRLEKKHGSIPIILQIVDDVKSCSQLMLNQLLQQLRGSIQLPACLKVIGYLRRMNVFSEAELRLKFLQARDTWLQSILSSIPNDDPYYHVTKTIEAIRGNLFDVITQYRAVFSDDDSVLTSSLDVDAPCDSLLFHNWLVQKVSQFLNVLERSLERGVGSRLDALLGQCMYFGLSFSRVGADFRPHLAPIFQRAALSAFNASLETANARFDADMQSFTLLGSTSSTTIALPLSSHNSDDIQPPLSLLNCTPLARFCNALLTSFNDLRLCCPVSIAHDVIASLQSSLRRVSVGFMDYQKAEEATFNDNERGRYSAICQSFASEFIPFVDRCLRVLFPSSAFAQSLGANSAELQNIKRMCSLNATEILEPMMSLIKVEEETVDAAPIISSDPSSQDVEKLATEDVEAATTAEESIEPESEQSGAAASEVKESDDNETSNADTNTPSIIPDSEESPH